MLHITSLDDGLDIFKALGSDVRIEIIKLLIENKEMNMNELAAKLNITNGALTGHIKKLESLDVLTIPHASSFFICPVRAPFVMFSFAASSFMFISLFSINSFIISIRTSEPSALKMSSPSSSEVM